MRQIIWAYPRAYLSLWTLPPFSHHRDPPHSPHFSVSWWRQRPTLLCTWSMGPATLELVWHDQLGDHPDLRVSLIKFGPRPKVELYTEWSSGSQFLQLWVINTMGSSSRGSGSWRFWRVNNWGTWTLGTPKSTSQFESSVPLLFDGHISQSWRQTLCPNMSEYEYLSENLPKDVSRLKKSQSNQNQHGYLFTYRDTYHG